MLAPVLPLVVAVAHAGPKEEAQAEHTRLAEEMHRLAARNAWRGVEARYLDMLRLERKGVQLTYEDHLLGAQAARDLGRITDVYDRLLRAREVRATEEVQNWIAEIESKYGSVVLERDPRWKGEAPLSISEMPFEPDQRAAIEYAARKLREEGRYRGLLPFGTYTFGDRTFEVVAGAGQPVKVVLLPEHEERRAGERRDGFRVDLGAGFASVSATDSPGLHPAPYGGAALRAALGWEVELTRRLGLVAQAGYLGLVGGGGETATTDVSAGRDLTAEPAFVAPGRALDLFFVRGAASYWMGDLSLAAGPVWAGGRARATGFSANCDDPSAPGCSTLSGTPTDAVLSSAPVESSFVRAGGAAIDVFYGFSKFPGTEGLLLGVAVQGGLLTDLAATYPFGEISLAVAPGI